MSWNPRDLEPDLEPPSDLERDLKPSSDLELARKYRELTLGPSSEPHALHQVTVSEVKPTLYQAKHVEAKCKNLLVLFTRVATTKCVPWRKQKALYLRRL